MFYYVYHEEDGDRQFGTIRNAIGDPRTPDLIEIKTMRGRQSVMEGDRVLISPTDPTPIAVVPMYYFMLMNVYMKAIEIDGVRSKELDDWSPV
jgi:hypothetical protein